MTTREWLCAVVRSLKEIDEAIQVEQIDPGTMCFSSGNAVCVLAVANDDAVVAASYAQATLDRRQRVQHDEPVKIALDSGSVETASSTISNLLRIALK